MNNFDLEKELSSAFTEEPSKQSSTPTLALYMTPYCPFCIYVKSAISELELDVEMRNIYDQQHFEDLMRARKRATVPVLRISEPNVNVGEHEGEKDRENGSLEEYWLPESKDIVKYLQELKPAS